MNKCVNRYVTNRLDMVEDPRLRRKLVMEGHSRPPQDMELQHLHVVKNVETYLGNNVKMFQENNVKMSHVKNARTYPVNNAKTFQGKCHDKNARTFPANNAKM